jgi:hypothetical protein
MFVMFCFARCEGNTHAFMLMFSICHGKIGLSLHMKDIDSHVRQLYRLRDLRERRRDTKDYVLLVEELRRYIVSVVAFTLFLCSDMYILCG